MSTNIINGFPLPTRVVTMQETIKVFLAQWLGYQVVEIRNPQYNNKETQVVACKPTSPTNRFVFNPFLDMEMGRAQVYECILKAAQSSGFLVAVGPISAVIRTDTGMEYRIDTTMDEKENESHTEALLLGLYKALGGSESWRTT